MHRVCDVCETLIRAFLSPSFPHLLKALPSKMIFSHPIRLIVRSPRKIAHLLYANSEAYGYAKQISR